MAAPTAGTLTLILSLRERKTVGAHRLLDVHELFRNDLRSAVANLALRRWRFAVIFSRRSVKCRRTPEAN